MVLITATSGEVLGVFTGFNWQLPCLRSFGTRSCFLCYFPAGRSNLPDNSPQIWHATGNNEYFMYSKPDWVAFGLSDAGYGLQLDADLTRVTSSRTETFDNPGFGDLSVAGVV